MLKIVVRSKKDADAIKAMLRVFYPDWEVDVATLHGARRLESALRELEDIVTPDSFVVLMLGREDAELAEELRRVLPPNVAVHVVPRARIRNARIEYLAHEFAKARAKLRLGARWLREEGVYRFAFCGHGEELEGYGYEVVYDAFVLYGSCGIEILKKVLNVDVRGSVLMVRKMQGVHDIYSGRELVATIRIPDEGLEIVGELKKRRDVEGPELKRLVEANQETLKVLENVSKQFLEKYKNWVDRVVVPWSGGKDSTVALLLALEVFPRSKVVAVYTDTGLEFPHTRIYVETMARRLGVELVTTYAGIDEALKKGEKPMPSHDNRWCTGMKIEAIERAIARLAEGNTLVVIGDRDAESESRAQRPPVRRSSGLLYVAPIKFWGTTHVQLYILAKRLEPNPLYNLGFYRIGCYICPSLRSWELNIILMSSELEFLRHDELFVKFLKYKGAVTNQP